jgi:hypothetical protein
VHYILLDILDHIIAGPQDDLEDEKELGYSKEVID